MGNNTTRTLIGWKEIAAYLNCSLSSARRRESEGLPIFRVGGSVRASADEIDAWIRSGSPPRRTEADAPGVEAAAGEYPDLQEVISAFTVERDGRRFVVVPLGASGVGRGRTARGENSDEKYRELLEKAPVWIWETDARGNYKYSNGEVSRIIGCRAQEIVGRTLSDFVVMPEDLARVEEAFRALRADGGCVKHLEYRVANLDGELRRLRTYAEGTLDADGNLVGIRGISYDVTDYEAPRGNVDKNDQL